jgi:serine/threonine protein kinase
MQIANAVVIQFQKQIANDFHIRCMNERCSADALGDWIHVRASIEGSAPEVLRLFRSAYEGTQLETISYQAADMWAVGLLLALMLTAGVPVLDPDVTGKSSSSISDEAERMASAAKRLEHWVCNRVAVQYFACMLLLLVNPSLSAVLEAWFLTRLVMSWD